MVVGAGVYQVKFRSLDVPKGNAIVSSLGSLTYCHVSSWLASVTGEEVVNVRCDADVAYNVAFST